MLLTPSSRCECPFKCSERGLHARRPLACFGVAIGSVDRVIGNTARTCSAHIWQKAVAAVVMGIAISGMHYTGMAAAIFTAHSSVDQPRGAASVAETNLALAVAGITFVILVCALIASLFDRQFAVLAERETVLLRESEEQFRKLYRETPLPLYSLSPDGKIEQASDAWLELIGYKRAEAIGRRLKIGRAHV